MPRSIPYWLSTVWIAYDQDVRRRAETDRLIHTEEVDKDSVALGASVELSHTVNTETLLELGPKRVS